MDRICSWCGAWLATSARCAPVTTHGLCLTCLAELRSSLRRERVAACGAGITGDEAGAEGDRGKPTSAASRGRRGPDREELTTGS